MRITQKIWRTDFLTIFTVMAIVALGLYYLYSADATSFYKQLRWVAMASVGMIIVYFIDYRWLLRQAYLLYAAGLGLLGVVFLFPVKRGAQRWFELPGTGFNVQPSEIMKFCIILVLARSLMNQDNQNMLRGLIKPFLLVFIPLGLIMKQPDLGTALLFPVLLLAMIYCSGARLSHVFGCIGCAVAAAYPMWLYVMKDYQKDRIRAFWDPELYSAKEAFQLIKSLIAIGTGGLYGVGWMQGELNSLDLLPDKHTDFIFGIIAEEGGFIVVASILGLYFLFVLCGLHIARRCKEPGGKLIAVGITTIIGTQVLVNIGVVTAMLPTTGMTLPLISYGGSSLIITFALIGLLLNVSSSDAIAFIPSKVVSLNED